VWDFNSTKNDRILIEQLYPGVQDFYDHFHSMLNAFKDVRYMRIDNRPIFVVYKPFLLPDPALFISVWNKLAVEEGLADGFHFIGHAERTIDVDRLLNIGFNAVNVVRNGEYANNPALIKKILRPTILYKIFKRPLVIEYSLIMKFFVQDKEKESKVYPSIIPNWDHTPRSGRKGSVFHNSTPELFALHVKDVFENIAHKEPSNQIVFLKSWNEWGEGNYLEPDLKYGKQYIQILKKVKLDYENNQKTNDKSKDINH
jgi:hypothetical protein